MLILDSSTRKYKEEGRKKRTRMRRMLIRQNRKIQALQIILGWVVTIPIDSI